MYVSVDRCGPLGHHCNDIRSLHAASGPSRVRLVWRGPCSVCSAAASTAAPCSSLLIIFAGTGAFVTIVNLGPESAARINIMTNTKFYYSKNWSLLLVSLFCVAESINLSVKCLFRHSTGGAASDEKWRRDACSWPNENFVAVLWCAWFQHTAAWALCLNLRCSHYEWFLQLCSTLDL